MYILAKPLKGIISLEMSCLFILAIIFTPVVLGILSYINIEKSKSAFIIIEIIGALMFFIFTPLNVFLIFVILTLASVFVSYFAGEDFIWFKTIFKPHKT